jgi:hypothetical protein
LRFFVMCYSMEGEVKSRCYIERPTPTT